MWLLSKNSTVHLNTDLSLSFFFLEISCCLNCLCMKLCSQPKQSAEETCSYAYSRTAGSPLTGPFWVCSRIAHPDRGKIHALSSHQMPSIAEGERRTKKGCTGQKTQSVPCGFTRPLIRSLQPRTHLSQDLSNSWNLATVHEHTCMHTCKHTHTHTQN